MKEYICVVIPLYNKEATIYDCLQSIFLQTRLPDKIIIIDDGSTDKSLKCIDEFKQSHFDEGRIEVTRKCNGGVSSARNKGISLSPENSIICFLDADDEWSSSYIAQIEQAAHKFPTYKLFATGYDIVSKESIKNVILKSESPIITINYNNLEEAGEFPYFPSSFCARKSAFVSADVMFPESQHIGEDLSCFFLLGILYDTIYINKALVRYKIDTEGNTATKESLMDTPYGVSVLSGRESFSGIPLALKDIEFHDHLLLFFLKSRWKAGDIAAIKNWCASWKLKSAKALILRFFFMLLSVCGARFVRWSGRMIKKLKQNGR